MFNEVKEVSCDNCGGDIYACVGQDEIYLCLPCYGKLAKGDLSIEEVLKIKAKNRENMKSVYVVSSNK